MNNNEQNNINNTNLNNNVSNTSDNFTSIPNVNIVEDTQTPVVNNTVKNAPTPVVNNTVKNAPTNVEPVSVTVPNVSAVTSNTNNISQSNTVPQPQVQPNTVENTEPQVQQVTNPSNNNDNNGNKTNNKSTILLILLFILLVIFVFFLPNISEYFRNGKTRTDNVEVNNGVLVCNMEKEEDTETLSYEYSFNFTSKKITTSSYNITLESESKESIKNSNLKCESIKAIASDIKGIDLTCTSSDNIATMIQSNDLKTIDTSKLTKFTEAGGMYPEFKYKDNPYDVQAKLIKVGYDCNITAN